MTVNRILTSLAIVALLACFGCSDTGNALPKKEKLPADSPLFQKLSAEQTGINFVNRITEDENYNHILVDVVFNGAGVAVIDVNNDGLQDLFFAGNMESDRLYLNKGGMQFEDITDRAGIRNDSWSTAIAVADVNGDGWLDLYVGKYILSEPAKRQNVLYINNGDLTFTNKAAEYGVNDAGHCTAVNFFDYDKDGDMDLYVGNQPFVSRHVKAQLGANVPANEKPKYSDRLYRNDGNGRFTDVTYEAGITNYNYTLSVTVSDLNNDGWPDIFVASDYEEPDYYFQNNGNGTFTNIIHNAMRHISNFSMGVDIADFNNDGWMDIYTADMAPADNYRSKANMSGMNPAKFWGLALNGYHYQYMFNTLQLNNGNGFFSEIGHMADVAQTDWSWATLFADFDNDADKDLFVSNGQPKDTRNKDYINRRKVFMDSLANEMRARGEQPSINSLMLIEMAPFEKLTNYMFVNNNDLTFTDKAMEWGLPEKTWTEGGSYADLDNDGDLDLIISNMNDPAFVYENRATQINDHHFFKLKLIGDHGTNRLSYGAKAWIYYGDELQVQEVTGNRGYMSASDPVLHFGLGSTQKIDRLVVTWLDGRSMELKDVSVDQTMELKQADATFASLVTLERKTPLFQDMTKTAGIEYAHLENNYDDYKDEVLIPHRMSRLGPCGAVADVDGDGLEDVFLGEAAGTAAILFLQQPDQTFRISPSQPWAVDKACEDVGATFFDADGDGDQDLYVVSGGNEFREGDAALQDRLYLNDGAGNFTKSNALPQMRASTGVAKVGDLDDDGDLDLFVGGRQVPNQYGYPAQSFVLRNDGGKFSDITAEVAPDLQKPGMVSDALWMDWDGDKDQDLIVVGEWMPIGFYQNDGGKLRNVTDQKGFDKTNGWWNRIAAADMDGDGDDDLVVGNLGTNIKFKASEEFPFTVHVKDFDENGTNDVYLGYYQNGTLFPVRGRQCSSDQMPYIKKKFKNYDAFAKASLTEVLGEKKEGAIYHEVQLFESVYLDNQGDGSFKLQKLPNAAQIGPMYGIQLKDWNSDGKMDILAAGNYHEREVETTRSDAGVGTLLLGDGKGSFKAVSAAETGLLAVLDVRDLLVIEHQGKTPQVVILNNNNGLQVFRLRPDLLQ